jgi:hypothetical protein
MGNYIMLAYICLLAISMILCDVQYICMENKCPPLAASGRHPLGFRRTGAAVGFVCGARNLLEPFR